MKGIVFNLLEEVVCDEHGPATWDALIDRAGVEGAYTSLGNYPDDEMEQLVAAAMAVMSISRAEVLRWFGRQAMPFIQERYPALFTEHASARDFVLALNNIIHPEVRKLYPGARCPVFKFGDAPSGRLHLHYTSSRQMCMLAHGFVEGAAPFFGTTAQVHHQTCMLAGDPDCELRIAFG